MKINDRTGSVLRRAEAAAGGPEVPLAASAWLDVVHSHWGDLIAKVSPEMLKAAKTAREGAEIPLKGAADLAVAQVIPEAEAVAARGGSPQILPIHLIRAIATLLNYELLPEGEPAVDPLRAPADPTAQVDAVSEGSATATATTATASHPPAPPSAWRTPELDRLGRDMTKLAREGKLRPITGRESEVKTIIEVLCRTAKRNPLLIGPPGSGKTAIVEEFARKVAAGEVPPLLANCRVISVETSSIMGGMSAVGELEARVRKLLAEASHPDIILFLDEVHTIMRGSGLADMLKPALARGDIALIAATTDEEYRRYIREDGAFERRFQSVPIEEMGIEQATIVAMKRRDHLAETRGVTISDDLVRTLARFAESNMRNRTFPDKVLDLIEQCVAYAMAEGHDEVTAEDALGVVNRLVGVLVEPGAAVDALEEALATKIGIPAGEYEPVTRRLETTVRRLDVRVARPNLVVALTGDAAERSGELARTFARTVYGSEERVINVDMTQMTDWHNLSSLIGSGRGYVDSGRRLAIHELAVTPWSVVVFDGIDMACVEAQELVAKALADGYICDALGDRYYLSDAIAMLVLSSAQAPASPRTVGFLAGDAAPAVATTSTGGRLTEELENQIDAVLSQSGSDSSDDWKTWVADVALPAVAERYGKTGINLSWNDKVVDVLAKLVGESESRRNAESVLEDWLSPAAANHPAGLLGAHGISVLKISVVDGACHPEWCED